MAGKPRVGGAFRRAVGEPVLPDIAPRPPGVGGPEGVPAGARPVPPLPVHEGANREGPWAGGVRDRTPDAGDPRGVPRVHRYAGIAPPRAPRPRRPPARGPREGRYEARDRGERRPKADPDVRPDHAPRRTGPRTMSPNEADTFIPRPPVSPPRWAHRSDTRTAARCRCR